MIQSDSINEIAAAISNLQEEMPTAKQSGFNKFFQSNYSLLQDIIDVIKPLLKKNSLCFTQFSSINVDGQTIIHTQITHSSGQWIRGDYPVICKDQTDPQKLGSAFTYARRYALQAAFGIAAEIDDDGNSASGIKQENKSQPKTSVASQNNTQNKTDFNKNDFYITFGKFKGKKYSEIKNEEVIDYAKYLIKESNKQEKPLKGAVKDFVDFVKKQEIISKEALDAKI